MIHSKEPTNNEVDRLPLRRTEHLSKHLQVVA